MIQGSERIIKRRHPIAVVRLDDLAEAVQLSRALYEGEVKTLEFTFTNAEAPQAIDQVRQALGDSVTVGAGTVLDAEQARIAIQAGAQFLVTPTLLPEVIEVGRVQGVPVLCGALTPTEILTAWRAGAEYVKVFPAGRLGPGYIKDILAPLPDILLVPTGGVSLDNCATFLAAGAYTVAIGSQLVDRELVRKKDWAALTRLARQYVNACSYTV
jgi:2-dehydro-3-deoxyphosphogluconate aldolase/(4S)-4-hydroxy-2-oxoglutarate aldolase